MLPKNKTVQKCCKLAKYVFVSYPAEFQSSNFAKSEDCFALRRVYVHEGQVYFPQRQSAKRPDFEHYICAFFLIYDPQDWTL